jgi:hypothetical protein
MSDQTVNEKGETLVTTTDVSTLEDRTQDVRELLKELLIEARLIRHMVAEAFELDLKPKEVDKSL